MVTLFIGLYFSLTLLTASLAKFDDISMFAASLRVSRFVPTKIVPLAQNVIPLGELTFAFLLLFQDNPITAAINLVLFVFFLGYKVDIASRNRASYCGCYGRIYRQKIDTVSITVSAIQVGLAGLYLWLVLNTESANSVVRLIVILVLIGFTCTALWRIRQRRTPRWRIV